jgi:hypothetical protein
MNQDQVDEYEALCAILGDDVTPAAAPGSAGSGPVTAFNVLIQPEAPDSGQPNWVALRLAVTYTPEYPESGLPLLATTALKGLDPGQVKELAALAAATAEENRGTPLVYTVVDRLREWLRERNEQQGDGSAFDEMMRRQKAEAAKGEAGAAGGAGGGAYSREDDPSLPKRVRAWRLAVVMAGLHVSGRGVVCLL